MEWMANQAGYYARAAQWLEKAELAHEVLGREDDWLCRPIAVTCGLRHSAVLTADAWSDAVPVRAFRRRSTATVR